MKVSSETILKVNRYIWKASLEVLSFLPLEGVDPFSGVITTGWGKPPGAKHRISSNSVHTRSVTRRTDSKSCIVKKIGGS